MAINFLSNQKLIAIIVFNRSSTILHFITIERRLIFTELHHREMGSSICKCPQLMDIIIIVISLFYIWGRLYFGPFGLWLGDHTSRKPVLFLLISPTECECSKIGLPGHTLMVIYLAPPPSVLEISV